MHPRVFKKTVIKMEQHQTLWTVTPQRLLLENLKANTCGKIFVPCSDQTSRAGFRASFSNLFTGSGLLIIFWPLSLVVIPLHAARWFWRRRQALPPGWMVDFDQRVIQTVRQKHQQTFELNHETGLLAHHAQIDITHPAKGPILTLFTAAPSRDPQDALALQDLAFTLSDRLQLRLVGCRVALH